MGFELNSPVFFITQGSFDKIHSDFPLALKLEICSGHDAPSLNTDILQQTCSAPLSLANYQLFGFLTFHSAHFSLPRDLNANNLTRITKADFAGLKHLRVL